MTDIVKVRSESLANDRSIARRRWMGLCLIVALLFVQLWMDIGGFTFRLEDIVTIAMICLWLANSIKSGVFRYFHSRLNKPLLLWSIIIILGILTSVSHSLPPIAQKDAIINGFRLVLATCLFFVVYNHPLPAERKIDHLFSTVILVSFLTTLVALLQIAYWDGWLPFSLPELLTTFKPGADSERGREIFALFVGNTGTHTWSSMLAIQAITIFIVASSQRKPTYRLAGFFYLLLLVLILVRTSVRTSLLGLLISLFVIILIRAVRSPFPVNRVVKPLLLIITVFLGISLILFLAPQSYFLDRISQTIPRITTEGLLIDRASNIYGRLEYSANAFKIFLAFPIAGGGFGSYQTLSGMLGSISVVHAHNSYSQTLAEFGLLGGISLLWVIWAIFQSLRNAPPRRGGSIAMQRIWYLNVAAMIFLAFSAFFVNAFWDPNQIAFRMIAMGVLLHAQRNSWL